MCVGSYLYKCVLTCVTYGYFGKKMGDPYRYVRATDYPGATWVYIFEYLNIQMELRLLDRRIYICLHMDTQVFKYSHMQILKYTNVCMFGDMGLLVFKHLYI